MRELGEHGAKDPQRLPRNEAKMAEALQEYQAANSVAVAKLAASHEQSVAFFGGLQCVFLKHQASLFTGGAETLGGAFPDNP